MCIEQCAGLTAVAAHADNFLVDVFVHYRSDRLIRASTEPVLLANAESKEAYRRILVPVDFSDRTRKVVRTVLRAFPDAQMTFLHAFHLPNEDRMHEAGLPGKVIESYRARSREKKSIELHRFVDEFVDPKDRLISRVVQHGSPIPVISDYAKKMRADLIAIGTTTHEKFRLSAILNRSMARRLVDRTPSDVLAVPVLENGGCNA